MPPQVAPLVLDVAWDGRKAVSYVVYKDVDLSPINWLQFGRVIFPNGFIPLCQAHGRVRGA